MMKVTEKLDWDRVREAAEEQLFDLGDSGFCIQCGEEQGGCEPDARGYKCEACGSGAVYGACELMLEVS